MRIAIIGSSGHWGYLFNGCRGPSLDPVLAAAPGGDDEDVTELVQICRQNGHPTVLMADWRQMLDETKPELVIVNPRFDRNATITGEVLARGAHVFAEKPLALTEPGLTQVTEAITRGPGLVMPMLPMRYAPSFYGAWSQVRAGVIGTVRIISAQKSYKLGQRPGFFQHRAQCGGLIPWVGSHALDLIRWFAGSDRCICSVRASHDRSGNQGLGELEASALCQFSFDDGAMASASLDYLRPPNAASHGDDRIRVVGTKGVVEVRDGQAWLLAGEADQARQVDASPPRALFADVLAACEGDENSLVNAEDGLAVTRLCLAARQSADGAREIKL